MVSYVYVYNMIWYNEAESCGVLPYIYMDICGSFVDFQ